MFAKSTAEGEAGSGRRRQSRFKGKRTKAAGERKGAAQGEGPKEVEGRKRG